MKQGLLAKHFKAVAVKRLTAVETDPSTSNQHEFNGVTELKKIFGTEKANYPTRFVWLGDEQEAISEDGFVTWYDAREAHPTRSEFRLFYSTTPIMPGLAKEGDTLFVCVRTDNTVLVIVAPPESNIESQLAWLFGLPEQPKLAFQAQQIPSNDDGKLDFAVRYIFDELGIEAEEPEADGFEELLKQFGNKFPPMKAFSEFTRSTLKDVSPLDDADAVILAWMEREELLFKQLERHIVGERLKQGFMAAATSDVDGFMDFSLSVQNRRKARAGAALENHLNHIFTARKLLVGRNCITESKNRPDFLFPGCEAYNNAAFPAASLTMLGAKSSLKDRWRQVLSEAQRIETKHLMTLSPGISVNQTDEMKSKKLQLVVPAKLHQTYQPVQQDWLMDLGQFIGLVTQRQEKALS